MSFSLCAVIAEQALEKTRKNRKPTMHDPSAPIKIVYRAFVSEVFARLAQKHLKTPFQAKSVTRAVLQQRSARGNAPAMHGQTLGAQVALLQSPIPPAAMPIYQRSLNSVTKMLLNN
jgi:hypothetical protein